MQKVLIDTDIVIECLRGNPGIKEELLGIKADGGAIYYCPVTKAEIFHGMRQNEEKEITDFFNSCQCLDITDRVGEIAGTYLAKYHSSHSVEIADALIAAVCSVHRMELFTLNKKHYPMKDIGHYSV